MRVNIKPTRRVVKRAVAARRMLTRLTNYIVTLGDASRSATESFDYLPGRAFKQRSKSFFVF